MKIRFEPIAGKCGNIIQALMDSPDMPKDEGLLFKIRLSVEEAVENVVDYAYTNGLGWMEAATERKDGAVIITLTDGGKPFNPLEKQDPDITLSAEDRQIGGLGIFLCKQMMDSVTYKYENGCNILTMTKQG